MTTTERSIRDQQRWQTVVNRDRSAGNSFVYSVKTTGVYCRPSCAARLARRENVEFHDTPADAERAGFRACKRCHPDQPSANGNQIAAIEKACRLIVGAEKAVSLESLSNAVGMSAWHFHRVFKSQTGLTPKGYATAHRSQRLRQELSRKSTITSTIYNVGFGSSGRFYSNSKRMLGMRPAEFKGGGAGATIRFAVGRCRLGSILVAASDLGICAISLGDDPGALTRDLQDRFCKARLIDGDRRFERVVASVIAFVDRPAVGLRLPLHVQGTAFQQRVWQKLCEIPFGNTRTYAHIAKALGEPKAVRAVARACAANSLAVAIPCHRVVRADGSLSGYRWGIARKAKLLRAEQLPGTRSIDSGGVESMKRSAHGQRYVSRT